MTVNEGLLIIIMMNFATKSLRVLALEKYILRYGGLSEKAWAKVKELIAEADDVQPVVHGHWVEEPDRYFHWHCSECGYVISGPHREFNYCPKCGTKICPE